MGQPAATEGHVVTSTDVHVVMVPSPGGPVPTPLPHLFAGRLDGGLVATVKIGGKPVAVQGSTASNQPSHVPTPPGMSFQKPPSNSATVQTASMTVTAGGKGIARNGDVAMTCHDPADAPTGTVVATATVLVG